MLRATRSERDSSPPKPTAAAATGRYVKRQLNIPEEVIRIFYSFFFFFNHLH